MAWMYASWMLRSMIWSLPLTSPALVASSGVSGNPNAAPPSMDRNSCTFHVSASSGNVTGDGGMTSSSPPARSRSWTRRSLPPCFRHRCSKL
uniref:PLD1 n=1 Tax=Arundo donax TaxID=35708 RepID=A0A0A9E222_ARUDO